MALLFTMLFAVVDANDQITLNTVNANNQIIQNTVTMGQDNNARINDILVMINYGGKDEIMATTILALEQIAIFDPSSDQDGTHTNTTINDQDGNSNYATVADGLFANMQSFTGNVDNFMTIYGSGFYCHEIITADDQDGLFATDDQDGLFANVQRHGDANSNQDGLFVAINCADNMNVMIRKNGENLVIIRGKVILKIPNYNDTDAIITFDEAGTFSGLDTNHEDGNLYANFWCSATSLRC